MITCFCWHGWCWRKTSGMKDLLMMLQMSRHVCRNTCGCGVDWTLIRALRLFENTSHSQSAINPEFSVAMVWIHKRIYVRIYCTFLKQVRCAAGSSLLYTVSSSIVSQLCGTKCCMWRLLIGRLSPPCSYLISQAGSKPSASQQQQRRNRQKPNHFVIQDASLKFFILITSCSWR